VPVVAKSPEKADFGESGVLTPVTATVNDDGDTPEIMQRKNK
jgi:hypothetical protein